MGRSHQVRRDYRAQAPTHGLSRWNPYHVGKGNVKPVCLYEKAMDAARIRNELKQEGIVKRLQNLQEVEDAYVCSVEAIQEGGQIGAAHPNGGETHVTFCVEDPTLFSSFAIGDNTVKVWKCESGDDAIEARLFAEYECQEPTAATDRAGQRIAIGTKTGRYPAIKLLHNEIKSMIFDGMIITVLSQQSVHVVDVRKLIKSHDKLHTNITPETSVKTANIWAAPEPGYEAFDIKAADGVIALGVRTPFGQSIYVFEPLDPRNFATTYSFL
ncbi:hypothetical protein HDU96_005484 [Phlyctochytrium bullatum]|nr:hypothetical protein HDU96_005484 [Phlyctochytrium bullatum]